MESDNDDGRLYTAMEKPKVIKKPIAPCKDCKERKENCHAECVRYITYSVDMQVYRYALRQAKKYAGIRVMDYERGEG